MRRTYTSATGLATPQRHVMLCRAVPAALRRTAGLPRSSCRPRSPPCCLARRATVPTAARSRPRCGLLTRRGTGCWSGCYSLAVLGEGAEFPACPGTHEPHAREWGVPVPVRHVAAPLLHNGTARTCGVLRQGRSQGEVGSRPPGGVRVGGHGGGSTFSKPVPRTMLARTRRCCCSCSIRLVLTSLSV